jgi:hypothetical protein
VSSFILILSASTSNARGALTYATLLFLRRAVSLALLPDPVLINTITLIFSFLNGKVSLHMHHSV